MIAISIVFAVIFTLCIALFGGFALEEGHLDGKEYCAWLLFWPILIPTMGLIGVFKILYKACLK